MTRGSATADGTTRAYRLYVPAHRQDPPPLIVMLHGGTQDADTFADATGIEGIAEREGFLVVHPEQSREANPLGYWNWFVPANQERDRGEPAAIAAITRAVAAEHGADPARVFVAGLSAGGAMAAVLAAVYPEDYAGVGVHSALPYRAAHDVESGFAAMRGGPVPDVDGGPLPLIVVHGDVDETVAVVNARHLVDAALRSAGDTARTSEDGSVDGGHRWTRERWGALVECWTIHGMGHAWSGGRPGGSYTDPQGPDAAEVMVRFFGATRST